MASERIILGIDPGTTIMGFGLIKVVGKSIEFMQLNELKLSQYDDHYVKLKHIFERTISLIDTYNPDEIAIEAPFFGKNVQSMLKLGRAQGVAMAAGLSREVPITEYSPKKIKMAILHLSRSIQQIHSTASMQLWFRVSDMEIISRFHFELMWGGHLPIST